MAPQPLPSTYRIDFPRVFSGRTLVDALSKLHYSISKAGYRDIELNFTDSITVLESGMLPLIPILNRYIAKERVTFILKLPREPRLRVLFERSNWAHFIDPFHYTYDEDTSGTHCPALRFSTPDEQFQCVDKVLGIILNSIDVTPDVLKAIEWSVNEITDNVLNHAGKGVPGYIQATSFRENKIVEFVVADAGIGIPRSLGETDHCRALERAVQEGVTRNKSTNQGNGLYGSLNISMNAGGVFNIQSDFGSLFYTAGGELKIRKAPIPYRGTTVLWNMRTDASDVISKAFVFGGRLIEPAYGFFDRLAADDAVEVNVLLKEQFKSLGSRDAGDIAHTYIKNILRSRMDIVLNIDFTGINILSSSFADEVFGRLFVELGPIPFMSRLRFSNADPEVLALINRAMIQRGGMDKIDRA